MRKLSALAAQNEPIRLDVSAKESMFCKGRQITLIVLRLYTYRILKRDTTLDVCHEAYYCILQLGLKSVFHASREVPTRQACDSCPGRVCGG